MWSASEYASAYDRHKKLINDYLVVSGKPLDSFRRDTWRDKTDYDVIRENHKFLWEEEDTENNQGSSSWGARLAKKYYDKLFKEYCICDLSYYKYNKVALRWRTEKELIAGKGQFICGSKKCEQSDSLRSWEVNFGYVEQGEKKNALVKLRLCPECSNKLNHKSQKRQVKRKKAPLLKRLDESPRRGSTSESCTARKTSEMQVKEEEEEKGVVDMEAAATQDASQIWKEAPNEKAEKSREEEFEEYLADLLL